MIQDFCGWLQETPLSLFLQNHQWITPGIQTLHILCVSLLMANMALLNVRMLGFAARRRTISEMVRRLLPWMWPLLVMLLVTGTFLTITEPYRELMNPAYRAKMSMIALVASLAAVVRSASRVRDPFLDRHQTTAKILAVTSMILWLAILTAGRWIAYVEPL